MKKIFLFVMILLWLAWGVSFAAETGIRIEGRRLVSGEPPFALMLPSGFQLVHSSSQENPAESSRTRVYFLVKVKEKVTEEMLILQIADKTNPQAGPMVVPPLRPYTDDRMYSRNRIVKGKVGIDYLIQLMAWNPDAPSLKPIVKKGVIIPHQWALQGQFIFGYKGDHAVFVRYSKDSKSFGLKISEEGRQWDKQSISGNEKKALEDFQKVFLGMVESINIMN